MSYGGRAHRRASSPFRSLRNSLTVVSRIVALEDLDNRSKISLTALDSLQFLCSPVRRLVFGLDLGKRHAGDLSPLRLR